jgi:hypothetical protein
MKDNYLALPPLLSPKTWECLLQEDDEMEAGESLSKSPLNNVPIKTKHPSLDIPSEIKEEMGASALNDWPSTLLESNDMHPHICHSVEPILEKIGNTIASDTLTTTSS